MNSKLSKRSYRIGIDMDDVICDTTGALRRWADSKYSLNTANLEKTPVHTLLDKTQHAEMVELLEEGSFFGALEPFPDAIEVLENLQNQHDVFIVTAALQYPACMIHKYEWIRRWLPFFDPLKVVFCGEKYFVDVDFLIDDSSRHFERLRGEGILFSAPKNLLEKRYFRVDNWRDVPNAIMRYN